MDSSLVRRDFIWNTLGNAAYALAAAFLAFAAIRLAGADEGGIFGFAYSTLGQQMFIIAYFGIRPFHITDTAGEYSYADYRRLRRFTVSAACLAALLYAFFMTATGRYAFRKSVILIAVVSIKICDGAADLYESECQRIGFLYIGGRELFLRTVLITLVFVFSLMICGSVLIAATAVLIAELAVIIPMKHYTEKTMVPGSETAHGGGKGMAGLFSSTLLLFFAVFLDFYVFSASKYAVDLRMDDSANGIYNIIFMPTSVIYLVANFVIRPYLSRLSKMRDEGDYPRFREVLGKLTILTAAAAFTATLAAVILGGTALRIAELILGSVYEGVLTGQKSAFVLIILGGSMYALSCLFYYVLVILRRQKDIFIVYLCMTLFSWLISGRAVAAAGIGGAAASYAGCMAVLALCFALIAGVRVHREARA